MKESVETGKSVHNALNYESAVPEICVQCGNFTPYREKRRKKYDLDLLGECTFLTEKDISSKTPLCLLL